MKKIIAVILSVLLLLGLAACSKSEGFEAVFDQAAPAKENAPDAPKNGDLSFYNRSGSGTESKPAGSDSQKLIRKISLTVETEDYRSFLEDLTRKIAALGGYVEEIEASTSGRYPYATLTVRVPVDALQELTDSVAAGGNITYQRESQQDVTLQYVDTESHISALRAEQDRLLELLDQAAGLSELLEIEDRLTQVRYQLESYERSLRALANQVEYATVTIELSQVKAFSPTEQTGFWENIRIGLRDNLSSLWELLKDIFTFLAVHLPYLLLFLVLPLVLLVVLIKRSRRRAKARPNAAAQPRQNGSAQAPQPQQNGPSQAPQPQQNGPSQAPKPQQLPRKSAEVPKEDAK